MGGLLDVAFDPRFASNKMMYWCYAEGYSSGNLTAVAKGKLNEAEGKVEDVSVIFPRHSGYQQYLTVWLAAWYSIRTGIFS